MPTILIKKSDTPGAVPTGSDLTNLAGGAEIAVNTADKRVFSMNSSSAIIELGINPSSLTTADLSATIFRAGSATISNLIAADGSITVDTVVATSGAITTLGSSSATLTNLTSTSGTVTTLVSTSATLTTIAGTSANITTITENGSPVVVQTDIGTAPNEIPLNQYLGTMAFQDATAVTIDQAAIDSLTVSSGSTLNGGVVINELGADADTRIEGDTDANLFFVDASTDRIGVGTNTPATKLDVNGSVTLSTGTANGVLYLNGSKEATSGSVITYDGTTFGVDDAVVINESGGDNDTRIEGDTDANLLFVDASEDNIGIGTNSTDTTYRLTVQGVGTSGNPMGGICFRQGATDTLYVGSIATDNDTDVEIYNPRNGYIRFATNNLVHMLLDASGNLGIGTSSPGARLTVDSGSAGNYAIFNSTNANGGYAVFNSSGTTHGDIGTAAQVVGGGSASDFGINARGSRNLIFGTNNTERARITAGGFFGIGTTNPGLRLTVSETAAANTANFINDSWDWYCIQVHNTDTVNNNLLMQFVTDAASARGSITYNRTAGLIAYNTTSDIRLKENIADAEEAGSKIDAMQVRQFDWKETGNHLDYGFVAQELHAVAPHAVSKPEDEEAMWSVDYSKLVPMLVKEIQSLRQRVAQLEAK